MLIYVCTFLLEIMSQRYTPGKDWSFVVFLFHGLPAPHYLSMVYKPRFRCTNITLDKNLPFVIVYVCIYSVCWNIPFLTQKKSPTLFSRLLTFRNLISCKKNNKSFGSDVFQDDATYLEDHPSGCQWLGSPLANHLGHRASKTLTEAKWPNELPWKATW